MKILLRTFMIPVIIMFTFVVCCGSAVSANDEIDYDDYDYDVTTPFCGFGMIAGKIRTFEYMYIWQKNIPNENFTIDKGQHLIIEPIGSSPDTMSSGRLVITNGTTATIKGDIFIERGGVLEIEDGTVVIDGGNITNCGTVKIGKKGTLNVLSGTLNSTAAGSIRNDGTVTCLTTGKLLDSRFKSIEKYDGNFNLSDYAILIDSDGSSAKVTANYCIGDIKTNYKYRFDIDADSKKIKIVRTDYSLETVYDSQTAQELQGRTLSFENEHKNERRKMQYWKDYGYTYNYRNSKLVYTAKWFSYDHSEEKFVENDFSEKI